MVSILLDIIKFLLIYRYLQNAYWFKRGDSVLAHPTCPGLRIALFAEKDNAESPRMDILFPYATNRIHTMTVYIQQITIGYNTPTVNIYHCLILLRISLKLRS